MGQIRQVTITKKKTMTKYRTISHPMSMILIASTLKRKYASKGSVSILSIAKIGLTCTKYAKNISREDIQARGRLSSTMVLVCSNRGNMYWQSLPLKSQKESTPRMHNCTTILASPSLRLVTIHNQLSILRSASCMITSTPMLTTTLPSSSTCI